VWFYKTVRSITSTLTRVIDLGSRFLHTSARSVFTELPGAMEFAVVGQSPKFADHRPATERYLMSNFILHAVHLFVQICIQVYMGIGRQMHFIVHFIGGLWTGK
jgi:hypothetical protein